MGKQDKYTRSAHNKANLTGEVFTRLTVGSECGRDKHKKVLWLCVCACGAELKVTTERLKSGNTKSCGCLQRDTISKINTSHGLRYKPEYSVWAGIKKRCLNKNSTHYKDYGGRGITICSRWINDFKLFYLDMGPRPSPSHEIDRINNNGDYSPGNCRWSTRKINQENKRTSKKWIVNGVEYASLSVAASELNVSAATILNWCDGYLRRGKRYEKKPGCYSEPLYV